MVAQLNPQMPYTFGDGELPIDWIDRAVEVDEPLASPRLCDADDGGHADRRADRPIRRRRRRHCSSGIGLIPTVAAGKMVDLPTSASGPRCSAMASLSSTDQGPLTPTD